MSKRLWIIIAGSLSAVALAGVGCVTFTASSASTAYTPRQATVSSSAPTTTMPPAFGNDRDLDNAGGPNDGDGNQ